MNLTMLPDPRGAAARAMEGPTKPDERSLYDALLLLARENEDDEVGAQLLWARELASWPSALSPSERDGLLLLALAVRLAAAEGSTRLPLDEAQPWLAKRLAAHADDESAHPNWVTPWSELASALRQGIPSSFAEVLGRPGEYKPLILDGVHVYAQRMWHHERRLVEALAARLRAGGDGDRFDAASVDEAARGVLARPPLGKDGQPMRLSDEQERAVRATLSGRLTLVSGGPGTGKTSIVVSMLRALARLGVPMERVALAAPTGKAANRMAEAIAGALATLDDSYPDPADRLLRANPPEARTLHRLLGYSPATNRFRQHEANPLAEEVVIVDEGSMIDLRMMDALVRAVRPEARLVLLGDAAQLPSVEAGAVFSDLCAAGVLGRHAVQLTKSYRMRGDDPEGQAVLGAANAVVAGDFHAPFRSLATQGLAPSVLQRVEALRYSKVELLTDEALRQTFLERWFDAWVLPPRGVESLTRRRRIDGHGAFLDEDAAALKELLERYERSRLLCVTRRQPKTGADDVNRAMHERLRDALRLDLRFLPGEPVMVQHNDYGRELWNGDQGVVAWVRDAGAAKARLQVVFRRGERLVAHPLDEIRGALAHAYAITVHKAQGSECDRVALLLPDDELPLFSRELLYTAMTRARRSVVLVGDERRLAFAVDNLVRRWSGLAEGLAAEHASERHALA